jgi:tetratricopeptide (TPR) repeat protein
MAEAESLLDAALRRRPNDVETRLHLAEELWSGGRQLAAADSLTRLVQEHPADVQLALRLAEMELEIGRAHAASEALELAFRSDPYNVDVLRKKAQIEEREGDTAAALATYHRLVQAAPDDIEGLIALAELHLRRGHPDRAAPLLRSVVDHPFITPSQCSEARWLLGESYAASERWSDAAECLAEALRQRPEPSAEDWFRLASAQAHCGQPAAALASVQQTLRREPEHSGAQSLIQQLHSGTTIAPTAILPTGFQRQASEPAASERL